jgi:hypothetical protein
MDKTIDSDTYLIFFNSMRVNRFDFGDIDYWI